MHQSFMPQVIIEMKSILNCQFGIMKQLHGYSVTRSPKLGYTT